MIRPPDSTFVHSIAPRVRTGSNDPRLRVELLDLAARHGVFAGWVTIGVTAFAFLLLMDPNRNVLLCAWTAVLICLSAVRILSCRRWQRERRIERSPERSTSDLQRSAGLADPRRLQHWDLAHTGIACCSGLAWASLVFLFDDAERTALLVGFPLAIALVLATSWQAASHSAYVLFALPIVLAQALDLQRLSVADHGLLLLAWGALVAAFYLSTRFSSAALRDSLGTRIEHERRAVEQTAMLETAPLGILVARDTRITVCNDALLKLLGYERKEQLIGKSVRLVFPDDDAWREALADATAAMSGPVPPRIVRRRRSDGSTIEVKLNVACVKGADSEYEFIGIYEDVQHRIAIEESYRHAVRMQRLVFETAGEGIAIVADGLIEQANQAMSDLLGWPVAQFSQRPLHSIFEDPQGWLEIEKRFQRLGSTLKLERRVVRSDGHGIWVNVTGCVVDAPAVLAINGHGPAPTATASAGTTGHRSIWIVADLSAQKLKEAENWHHANHDVMTGLPNRRFIQDRLDQALAFARRDGRRVAVVELDLDGFKSVNDTYGHRFGDAVLEEVARRLSTVVRELDTVGRWGGDEFVLVLKDIESHEVVEDTVKRVIARLSEPIVYQDHHLSVGASIGIALFPDHGIEVEVLMLAADLAMYESKASGGNTWRFSSPTAEPARGKYRPGVAQVSVPN